MRILTVEDIMSEYGLSRKNTIRLLNTKGCPILPRTKGQKYQIAKESFDRWILERK